MGFIRHIKNMHHAFTNLGGVAEAQAAKGISTATPLHNFRNQLMRTYLLTGSNNIYDFIYGVGHSTYYCKTNKIRTQVKRGTYPFMTRVHYCYTRV